MRAKTLWFTLIMIVLVLAASQPVLAGGLAGDDGPGKPGEDKPERGPSPDMPTPETPESDKDGSQIIPNRYIVVFNNTVTAQESESTIERVVKELGGTLHYTYASALKGFAATLSEKATDTLRKDPGVAYIEPDQVITFFDTQPNATWGLDRIDQRDLPLNSTYTYNYNGAGVHAYIIDTGIRITHNEFGGRASHAYDSVGDGQNGNDCNGHGTHVAGTVGGSTYGVAKNVSLYAVRVLDCNGSGTTSGVIAGVDWVTANHQNPAVANMSLGGSASSSLDTAVNNSINSGVTYAIAAGNSNANACNYSPARVAAALTVGATTSADARASYSNFGSCLDLFAPGSSITSAWNTSDSATNTINGTSMATPHVAGVAALYLDANPGASPSTVASAIVNSATTGRLSNIGSGSPNRLLYSLFDSAPVPTPTPGPGPTPTPTPGPGPCPSCEHYTGALSGTGDYDYHPNGTYYNSGSGTHLGFLEGPAGADFDLYLYKWSRWYGWYVVASATSSDSSESISYNGASGYYLWEIYSYSGSGNYDFWLDRP